MKASAAQQTRRPHRDWPPAPSGPRNCMRSSSNARQCDVCACTPVVLHTPIRERGRFCAVCCPHCRPVDEEQAMAVAT